MISRRTQNRRTAASRLAVSGSHHNRYGVRPGFEAQMPIVLTPFTHGTLCQGCAWTIGDVPQFAQHVAQVALGHPPRRRNDRLRRADIGREILWPARRWPAHRRDLTTARVRAPVLGRDYGLPTKPI